MKKRKNENEKTVFLSKTCEKRKLEKTADEKTGKKLMKRKSEKTGKTGVFSVFYITKPTRG